MRQRSALARQRRRWRGSLGALLVAGLGGACGEQEPLGTGLPATLEECGEGLDVLLARSGDAVPPLDASYSQALAGWSLTGGSCGLGIFTGTCADGKRLLYRNGGFTAEIRYYQGEQLVGHVSSGDVGACPSVCPFSRYHGELAAVRCDAPSLEALCPPLLDTENPARWMPFSNGQAPGGCDSVE